jgi:hypothetical protein
MSPVVVALPSSHKVPSVTGTGPQLPAAQVPTLH